MTTRRYGSYTKKIRDRAVALYKEGMPVSEICRRYSVRSPKTVYNWANVRGISPVAERKKRTKRRNELVRMMIIAGNSYADIHALTGLELSTIQMIVGKRGPYKESD